MNVEFKNAGKKMCMVAVILLISILESLCTAVPICSTSKHFKCFALGVQCRLLDINGNSSQGRFPKYGKILEKKKTISGNPVGNPSEPSRNQAKRIVNNLQVSHLKLELNTANNRNKTDNVLENINTEQRERKIYSRLIDIHELSNIPKEIIKQDESVS